jgi:hypothetical protein
MEQLKELGILQHVSAISTTSGGGLAGAYYATKGTNIVWPEGRQAMGSNFTWQVDRQELASPESDEHHVHPRRGKVART